MMLEAVVRAERAWWTDGGRSRVALAAEAQNRWTAERVECGIAWMATSSMIG